MVARINNELLSQALLTPRPEVSDSDDVLLALETARALETQGEMHDAARWLRRAADEAEQQGDDARVLVLARAAADMSSRAGSTPPAGVDSPTLPPPAPEAFAEGAQAEASTPVGASAQIDGDAEVDGRAQIDGRAQVDAEAQIDAEAQTPRTIPPLEAIHASMPPLASTAPTLVPPTLPPPLSAPATISSPPDTFAERSMRIGAIRVAILESSIRGAKSFFVERLERGQLPPPGSTEAMLVFTGDTEDSVEQQEVNLLASDSMMP